MSAQLAGDPGQGVAAHQGERVDVRIDRNGHEPDAIRVAETFQELRKASAHHRTHRRARREDEIHQHR
jgi:hypothetical protein